MVGGWTTALFGSSAYTDPWSERRKKQDELERKRRSWQMLVNIFGQQGLIDLLDRHEKERARSVAGRMTGAMADAGGLGMLFPGRQKRMAAEDAARQTTGSLMGIFGLGPAARTRENPAAGLSSAPALGSPQMGRRIAEGELTGIAARHPGMKPIGPGGLLKKTFGPLMSGLDAAQRNAFDPLSETVMDAGEWAGKRAAWASPAGPILRATQMAQDAAGIGSDLASGDLRGIAGRFDPRRPWNDLQLQGVLDFAQDPLGAWLGQGEEFRERPMWQQLGISAATDPTNLLGIGLGAKGLTSASRIVRALARADEVARAAQASRLGTRAGLGLIGGTAGAFADDENPLRGFAAGFGIGALAPEEARLIGGAGRRLLQSGAFPRARFGEASFGSGLTGWGEVPAETTAIDDLWREEVAKRAGVEYPVRGPNKGLKLDVPPPPTKLGELLMDGARKFHEMWARVDPEKRAATESGLRHSKLMAERVQRGEVSEYDLLDILAASVATRGSGTFPSDARAIDLMQGVGREYRTMRYFLEKATKGIYDPQRNPQGFNLNEWYDYAGQMMAESKAKPGYPDNPTQTRKFGEEFLTKIAAKPERWQYIKSIFLDPELTGQEKRRAFHWYLNNEEIAVGLQPKISSMALAWLGHTDVIVLDTRQIQRFWADYIPEYLAAQTPERLARLKKIPFNRGYDSTGSAFADWFRGMSKRQAGETLPNPKYLPRDQAPWVVGVYEAMEDAITTAGIEPFDFHYKTYVMPLATDGDRGVAHDFMRVMGELLDEQLRTSQPGRGPERLAAEAARNVEMRAITSNPRQPDYVSGSMSVTDFQGSLARSPIEHGNAATELADELASPELKRQQYERFISDVVEPVLREEFGDEPYVVQRGRGWWKPEGQAPSAGPVAQIVTANRPDLVDRLRRATQRISEIPRQRAAIITRPAEPGAGNTITWNVRLGREWDAADLDAFWQDIENAVGPELISGATEISPRTGWLQFTYVPEWSGSTTLEQFRSAIQGWVNTRRNAYDFDEWLEDTTYEFLTEGREYANPLTRGSAGRYSPGAAAGSGNSPIGDQWRATEREYIAGATGAERPLDGGAAARVGTGGGPRGYPARLAPAARPAAAVFDAGTSLYHGTPDVESWVGGPVPRPSAPLEAGPGVYTTPQGDIASSYTDPHFRGSLSGRYDATRAVRRYELSRPAALFDLERPLDMSQGRALFDSLMSAVDKRLADHPAVAAKVREKAVDDWGWWSSKGHGVTDGQVPAGWVLSRVLRGLEFLPDELVREFNRFNPTLAARVKPADQPGWYLLDQILDDMGFDGTLLFRQSSKARESVIFASRTDELLAHASDSLFKPPPADIPKTDPLEEGRREAVRQIGRERQARLDAGEDFRSVQAWERAEYARVQASLERAQRPAPAEGAPLQVPADLGPTNLTGGGGMHSGLPADPENPLGSLRRAFGLGNDTPNAPWWDEPQRTQDSWGRTKPGRPPYGLTETQARELQDGLEKELRRRDLSPEEMTILRDLNRWWSTTAHFEPEELQGAGLIADQSRNASMASMFEQGDTQTQGVLPLDALDNRTISLPNAVSVLTRELVKLEESVDVRTLKELRDEGIGLLRSASNAPDAAPSLTINTAARPKDSDTIPVLSGTEAREIIETVLQYHSGLPISPEAVNRGATAVLSGLRGIPGGVRDAMRSRPQATFDNPLRYLADVPDLNVLASQVRTQENPVLRALEGLWNPSVKTGTQPQKLAVAYQRAQVSKDSIIKAALMTGLDSIGVRADILPVDADGFVRNIPGAKQGHHIADLMEMSDEALARLHITPEQKAYIDRLHELMAEAEALREMHGLERLVTKREDGTYYFRRFAQELNDVEIGRPSSRRVQRAVENAGEGVRERGVKYLNDPRAVLQQHLRLTYGEILNQELSVALEPFSLGPSQLVPEYIRNRRIATMARRREAQKELNRAVRDLRTHTRRTAKTAESADFTEAAGAAEGVRRGRTSRQTAQRALKRAISKKNAYLRNRKRIDDPAARTKLAQLDASVERARQHLAQVDKASPEQVIIDKGARRAYRKTEQAYKRRDERQSIENHIDAAKAELAEAKVEHMKAKTAYSRALERARQATVASGELFGKHEQTIPIQLWKNRFLPEEDAHLLGHLVGLPGTKAGKPNPIAWHAEVLSNYRRTGASWGDFAAPFIQGLPLLGYNPSMWAKATFMHYQAFFDPVKAAQWADSHKRTLQEMGQNGVPVGDTEFFTVMEKGQGYQWPKELIRKAGLEEGANTVVHQTFGRFQASYDAFLMRARAELWESLRDTMEPTQLASFTRNMTGGLDSRALGVGPSARAAEAAWLAFSPKLLRSTVALMSKALNPTTQEGLASLRALSGLTAITVGAYVALGTAKGMSREEILNGLNPLSGGDFLSIEVNGERIGPGGTVRAISQAVANIATTAVKNPGDLAKLDIRDNPLIRFYTGRGAPAWDLAGGATEALSGGDVLPYDQISDTQDFGKFLFTGMLPFAVQGVFFEDAELKNLPFTMAGVRTSPAAGSQGRAVSPESERLRQIKAQLEGQQIERSKLLTGGQMDRREWITYLQDATAQYANSAEAFFGEGGGEREGPYGEYLGMIRALTDKKTNVTDWPKIHAWRDTKDEEWNAEVDANVGQTFAADPVVQVYNKVRPLISEYNDQPIYHGYTADEARQIDELWGRARREAGGNDKLMFRTLESFAGEYSQKVYRATVVRLKKGGLKRSDARDKYRQKNPEIELFLGDGQWTSREIQLFNQLSKGFGIDTSGGQAPALPSGTPAASPTAAPTLPPGLSDALFGN
jgi:hypothetical protein